MQAASSGPPLWPGAYQQRDRGGLSHSIWHAAYAEPAATDAASVSLQLTAFLVPLHGLTWS